MSAEVEEAKARAPATGEASSGFDLAAKTQQGARSYYHACEECLPKKCVLCEADRVVSCEHEVQMCRSWFGEGDGTSRSVKLKKRYSDNSRNQQLIWPNLKAPVLGHSSQPSASNNSKTKRDSLWPSIAHLIPEQEHPSVSTACEQRPRERRLRFYIPHPTSDGP